MARSLLVPKTLATTELNKTVSFWAHFVPNTSVTGMGGAGGSGVGRLRYGESGRSVRLGFRADVDRVALEVGEAVFGVLTGGGAEMAGEGSAEGVRAEGDCYESRGEALAVVEDFAGDPVEFAGGFGICRNGYGQDDRARVHAGWGFKRDGELCV